MTSLVLLSILGCPQPCTGVGCEETFSAARVDIIKGSQNWSLGDFSPLNAIWSTTRGTAAMGPDWSMEITDQFLVLGIPAINSIYTVPLALSGSVDPELDAPFFLSVTDDIAWGHDIAWLPNETNILLVGAPLWESDITQHDQGALFVYEELQGSSTDAAQPALIITGSDNGGHLGEVVESCADLDNDGVLDWLVAAPDDSSQATLAGRVALNLSSQPATTRSISFEDMSRLWSIDIIGAQLGRAMHCRTNVLGSTEDNTADILIGSPFSDITGEAEGAIYVVSGENINGGNIEEVADRTLVGIEDNSWLGWSITTGDLDGDGYTEVIGGAPGARGTVSNVGDSGGGEVWIWEGEEFFHDEVKLPRFRILGVTGGDRFGHSLAVMDFNGDGFEDLIVGAPHRNLEEGKTIDSGTLYVFFGATNFSGWPPIQSAESADLIFAQASPYLRTGQSILGEDIDGDGIGDLILLHRFEPE